MATTTEFCLTQAAQCAASAASATLENQRDTFLRAETVWRGMADRAIKVASEREAMKSH